jgi:hypothetical protein
MIALCRHAAMDGRHRAAVPRAGGRIVAMPHGQEIIKQAHHCLNPVTLVDHIGCRRDEGVKAMMRFKALLIAAPIAAGLLAAPAAHADWHGHGGGGYHGGGYHGGGWHGGGYHGGWHGPGVAGAVIGLGAAAVIGGVIASQAYAPPPPVYYAPPPAYYAPPPGYYAPPPGYYPPGY